MPDNNCGIDDPPIQGSGWDQDPVQAGICSGDTFSEGPQVSLPDLGQNQSLGAAQLFREAALTAPVCRDERAEVRVEFEEKFFRFQHLKRPSPGEAHRLSMELNQEALSLLALPPPGPDQEASDLTLVMEFYRAAIDFEEAHVPSRSLFGDNEPYKAHQASLREFRGSLGQVETEMRNLQDTLGVDFLSPASDRIEAHRAAAVAAGEAAQRLLSEIPQDAPDGDRLLVYISICSVLRGSGMPEEESFRREGLDIARRLIQDRSGTDLERARRLIAAKGFFDAVGEPERADEAVTALQSLRDTFLNQLHFGRGPTDARGRIEFARVSVEIDQALLDRDLPRQVGGEAELGRLLLARLDYWKRGLDQDLSPETRVEETGRFLRALATYRPLTQGDSPILRSSDLEARARTVLSKTGWSEDLTNRALAAVRQGDVGWASSLSSESVREFEENRQMALRLLGDARSSQGGQAVYRSLQTSALFAHLGLGERVRETLQPVVDFGRSIPPSRAREKIGLLMATAQVYQSAGLVQESNGVLREVGLLEPVRLPRDLYETVLLAQGMVALNDGDLDRARGRLLEIPNHPTARALLGEMERGEQGRRVAQVVGVLRAVSKNFIQRGREHDRNMDAIERDTHRAWDEVERLAVSGESATIQEAIDHVRRSGTYPHFTTGTGELRVGSNVSYFMMAADHASSGNQEVAEATLRLAGELMGDGYYLAASEIYRSLQRDPRYGSRARDSLESIPTQARIHAALSPFAIFTSGSDPVTSLKNAAMLIVPFGVARGVGVWTEAAYVARYAPIIRSPLLLRTTGFGVRTVTEAGAFTLSSMTLHSLLNGTLGNWSAGNFGREFGSMLVTFVLLHGVGMGMQRLPLRDQIKTLANWGSRVGSLTGAEYLNEGIGLRDHEEGVSFFARLFASAVMDAQMMLAGRAVNAATGGRVEGMEMRTRRTYMNHGRQAADPDSTKVEHVRPLPTRREIPEAEETPARAEARPLNIPSEQGINSRLEFFADPHHRALLDSTCEAAGEVGLAAREFRSRLQELEAKRDRFYELEGNKNPDAAAERQRLASEMRELDRQLEESPYQQQVVLPYLGKLREVRGEMLDLRYLLTRLELESRGEDGEWAVFDLLYDPPEAGSSGHPRISVDVQVSSWAMAERARQAVESSERGVQVVSNHDIPAVTPARYSGKNLVVRVRSGREVVIRVEVVSPRPVEAPVEPQRAATSSTLPPGVARFRPMPEVRGRAQRIADHPTGERASRYRAYLMGQGLSAEEADARVSEWQARVQANARASQARRTRVYDTSFPPTDEVTRHLEGSTVDHHGRFPNDRNATMKLLDLFDEALEVARGDVQAQAEASRDRTLMEAAGGDPVVAAAIRGLGIREVTTDNLADGGWAVWISRHQAQVLRDPALRQLIREATYFEDYTAFGTEYGRQAPGVELQAALFARYGRILAEEGIRGSDRFLTPEQAGRVIDKAMQAIDELVGPGGGEVRAREAEEFWGRVDEAARILNDQAVMEGSSRDGQVVFYDLSRLKDFTVFVQWLAVPLAHRLGLQVTVSPMPPAAVNGTQVPRTLTIVAIPNGRQLPSGKGLLSVVDAINAAERARAQELGLQPNVWFGKDNVILPNPQNGGSLLSPQEVSAILRNPQMGLFQSRPVPEAAVASARQPASSQVAAADFPFAFRLEVVGDARRAEVSDWLAGRDVRALSPADQRALLLHLLEQRGWTYPELQAFVGVEGMRATFGFGERLPFGFQSEAQFRTFQELLMTELLAAGVPIHDPRVRVVIQGSAVRGTDSEGNPFQWGGKGVTGASNIDVAIVVDQGLFDGFVEARVEAMQRYRDEHPTRYDAHLPWNYTIGPDGKVKRTQPAKKLERAIERRTLDRFNLTPPLQRAHDHVADAFGIDLDLSIITPESHLMPAPDEAMALSAQMACGGD